MYHYIIYKITNRLNGKFYIGKHKTKNIDDGYMGSGKLIKAAIKKHGVENFEKEVLHVFETEAEMNEAEARLVIIGEDSYNLCPGGHGGFGYIHENGLCVLNRLTDEQKDKRRKSLSLIRKHEIERDPVAEKQRMRELSKRAHQRLTIIRPNGTWQGKRHSAETRRRMSEKAKKRTGRYNSQFGTCWVTNGTKAIKIFKEELDSYLCQGYVPGRKHNNHIMENVT